MIFSSVIVHDLNVFNARIGPTETNPPWVVDPDTVLACSIALERFESIPWWHSQRVERCRGIQEVELPVR